MARSISFFINPEERKDYIFESSSSTKIKVVNLRHTWTIDNFSSCGEELQSATFSAGIHSEKSTWSLKLNLGETTTGNNNLNCKIGLGLRLVKFGNNEIIYAKYNLYILPPCGKKRYLFAYSNTNVQFMVGIHLDKEIILPKDFLFNKMVSEGKLTVLCEIVASVGSESILKTPIAPPQSDLTKHLEGLLFSEKWSDVILSVGGREFKAHKAILTARSPVFEAMFEHDMQESRNNRVEITDMDEEGLCGMLRYMYTGKIQKLEETAPRLLAIAKKYAISDLESACEMSLLGNLSFENAAETFILSDTFSSIDLKNEVLEFILNHFFDVVNTDGYVAMVDSHPSLNKEVFHALYR